MTNQRVIIETVQKTVTKTVGKTKAGNDKTVQVVSLNVLSTKTESFFSIYNAEARVYSINMMIDPSKMNFERAKLVRAGA